MKIFSKNSILNLLLLIGLLNACTQYEKKLHRDEVTSLFTLLDNNQTNIQFANKVTESLHFNFLNYSYIYNGAGVAVGDINNDGLPDLYFTANQGSNKLYLNKGNFKFEDITNKANVVDKQGWSTGVTMIDINNDGWLDIYVCKSGSLESHELRKNKLFINQKNNTFKESAASYGIDHFGFSTQAYFFDFDKDNDLDLYLVNHRQDFQNNTTINPIIQQNKEPYNSDQLFRNDNMHFTNVTTEAGITNKAWGLSASIGDFNNDNLPDIYVANDFLEPDFLYINQGNGTFKDEILTRFKHISYNSMGSDYADINNDLKPDLVVLDMMAEDHIRGKENMASMSTENFEQLVNAGYHHQYMSNMLQLNNNDGSFSEIGQLAGIAKTDWSWAPLIADFDNDGFNDLFVTNGIKNDLSNQDFRNQMRKNIKNRKKVSLEEAINMMPSNKLSNYIFRNNKNLTFTNTTKKWGLDVKVNSNGAIYADLDNDGDLDIVVNNQADEASIYKNNATNNFVSFSLIGSEKNKNGIGSIVYVYTDSLQQGKELYVSRGYQSSVTHKLHFGLGNCTKIDSVKITWSDGSNQLITNCKINITHILSYKEAKKTVQNSSKKTSLFEVINPEELCINFLQKENIFNDFDLQLLLPQKQSEKGSPLTIADVNGDGLDDFFVGNALGEKAALFIQNSNGTFLNSNEQLFEKDKVYEDTNAAFLDIDSDGDLDLYVASGGYELEENSPLLQDRLYINNGKGSFKKLNNLPKMLSNTKAIAVADYDKDGDLDLFIGNGAIHGKYPLANKPYLLENKNGIFKNISLEKLPNLSDIQLVNDAIFSDFDNDGDADLFIVGEWMPIVLFENVNKKFIRKKLDILKNSNGWYQSIAETDINKDGFKDYIIGNWGTNNKFHPTIEKPLHIYADYLDANSTFDVVLSKVSKTGKLLPVRGKECSSQQVPVLNKKITTFKEFASLTLPGIYGEDALKKAFHFKVNNLKSFILKNTKNGNFTIQELPIQAQFSPTLSIETLDINNDGYEDIFGLGNIYDTEVETIRYDASKGYLLFGDKNGNFNFSENLSFYNNNEAKVVKKIIINHKQHLIILNKNNKLQILKLN
ncbi:RNA-binding protein [Lutibacter profundi]|uniref:RNA-binding protein n=1 Tax=Lutibacter profundi TaxID=1622118 RepID=A0A120IEH1_9FLAO|nr:VCBS repeat-containing protein [Lutibacter profundi]AMC11635.1 RNA-binding protein [Lutibacter profundi]